MKNKLPEKKVKHKNKEWKRVKIIKERKSTKRTKKTEYQNRENGALKKEKTRETNKKCQPSLLQTLVYKDDILLLV